ncbi:MAG: hypothetical protein CMD03_01375, partial [Flavobacteriales bacterium]|nr:hypothetical protein [Flavobacteriales bacterium]
LENNDLYEIISSKKNTYRILLNKEITGSKALNYINTNYEVLSFKKESPTIEEIFIKAVKNA